MAENVGSDSSEFESISSSQKSYLKNCPFAGQDSFPTISSDSNNTEVLENQISPEVVKTPVLSFSSPTSLNSINDDVFRTPPENASLSSAADSEPRVRVSEIKLPEGSNLKSPSSNAETTRISSSPSENVRVLDSNLKSPSSTAETTRVSISLSEKIRVLDAKCLSDSVPLSFAADDVRVPAKHPDSDSASPAVIESSMGLKNPNFISVANDGALKSAEKVLNLGSVSATEGIKVSETENSGGALPFKEIIEALLRNSGEKPKERDENVSYVDILKKCGLKFP